jgi:hypothetical protein
MNDCRAGLKQEADQTDAAFPRNADHWNLQPRESGEFDRAGSTKSQTPSSKEISISKLQKHARLTSQNWRLEPLWDLVLGIWGFYSPGSITRPCTRRICV